MITIIMINSVVIIDDLDRVTSVSVNL